MKHSWRVGRIAGIDINIDSSWLVIFVIFTWVLAASYFPQKYPDWPVSQYLFIGILTSLLIFSSVLVHELAHSLVALRQGEKVRSITLFILGGVAQITEEPKKPMKEFLMAVVGPISSLVVALVFLFISLGLKTLSIPLSASAAYVALINVILAVFNLLPGFPMDGGRVLRSVIWKVTGDLKRATSIASKVGQGMAFCLIFLGILQILGGTFSGLWLIFIGWFLHSAAIRGYQNVVAESALKGVTAGDLMAEDFETVSGHLFVQSLVDDYILKKRERVFLVADGGRVRGIVCLEDVKAHPREKWADIRVEDIMTPKEKLISVTPEADGRRVLQSLTTRDIHQVPVMRGEEVAGIICRSDILRYIQLHSELGG